MQVEIVRGIIKMGIEGQRFKDQREAVERLIQRGWRASLRMQSFVTGLLYVALDFHPGTPVTLLGLDPKHHEVPTIPSDMDQLKATLQQAMGELKKIPLEALFSEILGTLKRANNLLEMPEIKQTLVALYDVVGVAERLLRNADSQVVPLGSKVGGAADAVRGTLGQAKKSLAKLTNMVLLALKQAEKTLGSGGRDPRRPHTHPRRRRPSGPSGRSRIRSNVVLKPCYTAKANRRETMRRCLPAGILALLSVCLLGLSGCASSPPTRFYVLPSLTSAETTPPAAPRDLTIGVGPVTLPPYLDRPQIVTRASRARLLLGEFDQWAASLQDIVTRTLAENLSLLIPTDRVLLYPWSRTTEPDYQATVEVLQFDASPSGEVVLAVRWRLLSANEKELVVRQARFTAAAGRQDYEATVLAMGRTLEALSQDMAAALLTLVQPAPRSEQGAQESLPAVARNRPSNQRPRKANGSSR